MTLMVVAVGADGLMMITVVVVVALSVILTAMVLVMLV